MSAGSWRNAGWSDAAVARGARITRANSLHTLGDISDGGVAFYGMWLWRCMLVAASNSGWSSLQTATVNRYRSQPPPPPVSDSTKQTVRVLGK